MGFITPSAYLHGIPGLFTWELCRGNSYTGPLLDISLQSVFEDEGRNKALSSLTTSRDSVGFLLALKSCSQDWEKSWESLTMHLSSPSRKNRDTSQIARVVGVCCKASGVNHMVAPGIQRGTDVGPLGALRTVFTANIPAGYSRGIWEGQSRSGWRTMWYNRAPNKTTANTVVSFILEELFISLIHSQAHKMSLI